MVVIAHRQDFVRSKIAARCPSGIAAFALLAAVAFEGSTACPLPAPPNPALSHVPDTCQKCAFLPIGACMLNRKRSRVRKWTNRRFARNTGDWLPDPSEALSCSSPEAGSRQPE